LTTWHCILNAELPKTHSFRPFVGDFAHWVVAEYHHLYYKMFIL